jgi:nucleoid-associated protein YgaU
VQQGDTLALISGRMYNDPSAWRKIFEANKGILPQPGSLRPGQVLSIPP